VRRAEKRGKVNKEDRTGSTETKSGGGRHGAHRSRARRPSRRSASAAAIAAHGAQWPELSAAELGGPAGGHYLLEQQRLQQELALREAQLHAQVHPGRAHQGGVGGKVQSERRVAGQLL